MQLLDLPFQRAERAGKAGETSRDQVATAWIYNWKVSMNRKDTSKYIFWCKEVWVLLEESKSPRQFSALVLVQRPPNFLLTLISVTVFVYSSGQKCCFFSCPELNFLEMLCRKYKIQYPTISHFIMLLQLHIQWHRNKIMHRSNESFCNYFFNRALLHSAFSGTLYLLLLFNLF